MTGPAAPTYIKSAALALVRAGLTVHIRPATLNGLITAVYDQALAFPYPKHRHKLLNLPQLAIATTKFRETDFTRP